MNRRIYLSALIWLITAVAIPCNIPVFRYALERWVPDRAECLVFYEKELSRSESQRVQQILAKSLQGGGTANFDLLLHDVQSIEGKARTVWEEVRSKGSSVPLPYVVIRTRVQDRLVEFWRGALAEMDEDTVFRSPVRQKVCQRLLAGDSVVWLLIKGKDAEKNREIRELLDQEFVRLGKELPLPEGIGEPGSELYADVPLFLKFTYLELDPEQPAERDFVRFLTSFWRQEFSEPLVVPVFGRGRALEVIPASQVDRGFVEDLTQFLCGPCSCQVKERNPGFDLLLAIDWEKELFGEGITPPPSNSKVISAEPKLVPIPSGRK